MSKTFGIDVSYCQKGFNFEQAKTEGVEFVIIKASQDKFKDPQFESHYAEAKKAGMLVGAYHYLVSTTVQEAKEAALWMVDNCLKGKTFEYPIFVDVENKALRMTKAKLNAIIKAFCETLEGAGYWAGFYCNWDFYNNECDGLGLSKRFSLWFAFWGKNCPVDCQMWQFGGETNLIRTNEVAGVVCDQNYSFKDFPTLIKQKGLNGLSKENAKPVIKEPNINVGDKVRIKKGAKVYGTNGFFDSWVYNTDLYVREINKERVVVSIYEKGAVTGAVNIKDVVVET